VIPLASKQPNRKCSCGCGRPGRYLGRLEINGEAHFLGYFATKQERQSAREAKRLEVAAKTEVAARPPETVRATVGEYIARYLARYERARKASSYAEARCQLTRLQKAFGERPLGSITRAEAIAWADGKPGSLVKPVVTLFNAAVDEELIARNPFRGLTKYGKGRSNEHPPTPAEWERLYQSCEVLGHHAPQMRALMIVAAYSGMRPGELMALEWGDIDFEANRIYVQRRLYQGVVDLPKNGKAKTIALTPPAKEVLEGLPSLDQPPVDGAELVFRSKAGKRLSQPTLTAYWAQVRARAGLEHDFYLATKHLGVHLLYKLGLSKRAIAAQMGWGEKNVEELLRIYGHADLVALAEVDALYADEREEVEARGKGGDV
jgi:integrase